MHNNIMAGPYTPTIVTTPAVPATEDSPAVPEQTTVETVMNMTPENRAHFESEKEAIHLILTGIGDEIYSTVDACQTAQEMWEAIERLQQGESLNIQDVKTNLFWEFGQFTSHDGETIESYYTRFYKMMNEMIRNNLTVATMQVNVQFLQQLQPEWSRFVTIVKQQHKLDEVSYHKLFDILKQYQKEVNELRAERMAKNANPLALVATAQTLQDPYYQTSKPHKSYAPTSKASLPTRSHATTRYKGKEIAKPITPPSESASEEDSDPEQAQKDKDMQKNLALIAKYFKKLYKPTNNNLRTSSNTRNKNVDTTPRYKNDNQTGQFGNQRAVNVVGARETVGGPVVQQSGIQCFNCKEFGHYAKECRKPKRVKDSTYHKEKMLLCKQAEKGVQLQAEQSDWLADTDEEIDEQELEAHYSYMAKIQEVPNADSGTDAEPLEQVQYDTDDNVFANDIQHFDQSESISNTCAVETDDSNVTPDSPDMCDNDIQDDQNDVECDDERVALANLIANLKLDVDENKKIQKQLKKANATLTQELTECKSILAETSRTLGESNSIRDSCLVALQNKQTEFERYKAFNDHKEDLDLSERNLKQCKRKICDGHYTAAVRVLSSFGVALYNDATLQELKAKHPFKSAPSLLDTSVDHHHLIASQDVVLDKIKSFPRDELVSSITQVVNLFLEGKCPMMLGEYIASSPLTPLVKPGGGIRPIVVGTVWRRLVSKVSATMIGHSLDGLQFGVGVPGGGEAILHAVNHLVEDRGDDVGLSMLLVDFKNAFNLAWYLDDGTIVGDTLVIGKVLELITEDGPRCGLHLNVDKTKMFWPKEDPRSKLEGVFPPNISRPLHGVKLLGGPVSVDPDFSSTLVMKRVSKTIGFLDVAQLSFDMALRSALERVVTTSGPGFGDWQWRLATLPFAFGGLGVYSAGDVLNYAFIASRLQYAALQTKLLRHVGIVAPGSTFLMTLCMALWQSEKEDHTSDWLRVVPISGLGQTMNGKTYCCVLCYRLGVPLFSVSKPCSACSKVFTGDIYGDHVVSCAGIIGIKHRHNVVRDTLVDICFRSGISAGKEVDIGLGGGRDKALRPADILYHRDGGLDVSLIRHGPLRLTQTGMADFVPGRAVTEAAQRKRVKYEAKCADIGYGFLPFSFSSFGELKKDAMTLLKRNREFSMAQDIGARAVVHIFNRISFSIAKGVGAKGVRAHIVSRLPFNLL
ncbi:retrovirus-related pol polyprotein from transposon TNT 1-94 [Tanacetum coccineum]